jgi:hypothetical protein
VEAVRELRAAHARTKLEPEARRALLQLFRRLRASTLKARHHALMRELERALVDVADPRWEPALIAMLEPRMPKPARATRKALLDQVYWQRTAIEVLGEMRSRKAVEPLIRVVLSPFKEPVAPAALLALTRIGRPAVPPLVRLLEGSAVQLVRYAQHEARRAVAEGLHEKTDDAHAERAHMAGALVMLGHLGIEEAKKPIMAATASDSSWLRRHAAAELHRLPKDPALVDRFKSVYAEVGVEERMYGGERAKIALLETAAFLFEPGMTKWLLDDVAKLGGDGEAVVAVKSALVEHAMCAAGRTLWPAVKRLHTEVLSALEGADRKRRERAFAEAKALLERCDGDAGCHAGALDGMGPEAMPARRAAQRLAILGDGSARSDLVRLAIATGNNHAREVLASALLAVSPEGDTASAKAIESAYSSAVSEGDEPTAAAVKGLVYIAAVLRARAAT